MPDLNHSARSLERSTYTPISLPNRRPVSDYGRAIEKLGYFNALGSSEEEFGLALEKLRGDARFTPEEVLAFSDLKPDLVPPRSQGSMSVRMGVAHGLASVAPTILVAFGHALQELRRQRRSSTSPSTQPVEAVTLSDLRQRALPDAASGPAAGVPNAPPALSTQDNSTANRIATTSRAFASGLQHALELDEAMTALHSSFQDRMKTEPVGFLHLERLSFTPSGIEKGELVHSLPLAPAQTVSISHKEWSNTSEEFQSIVSDYLESYSERGVSEKSELAETANAQATHSSGFNLGVTASGGFGPVSISSTVGYNVADSSTNSHQTARNESSTLTKKASARAKKEHKVSFKVATSGGTVDEATQQIVNPFNDRCTRIDYYQLVRRWRVDLSRYGIRLTYDIVIPEPGAGLLANILKISALRKLVQQGFNAPDSTEPWAKFDVTPDQLNDPSYRDFAAAYGVALDPPEEPQIVMRRILSRTWTSVDEAALREVTPFEIKIPDGYEVVEQSLAVLELNPLNKDNYTFKVLTGDHGWKWQRESVSGAVETLGLQNYVAEVTLTVGLTRREYQAWQMSMWEKLRDAANTRYQAMVEKSKVQLSDLEASLGGQDPLTLRQIEREEIMKNVLRWLFGPSFQYSPSDVPDNLYGKDEQVANTKVWAETLAQGDLISFLHHAIEWENMVYFLYPYFWAHASKGEAREMRKYLDHPDLMHRSFLRSGAARVVVTIRPGFEDDFLSFMDNGKPGLAHQYLSIGEELQQFAKTNFPGLPSQNDPTTVRPLLTRQQRKAWDDIQEILRLAETFKGKNGHYPTSDEGLAALKSLGAGPGLDPWGRPYVFRSPGVYGEIDVSSLGADGSEGGDGENADIVSWAEASLIGQWFEYTPTRAMDIAFDERMPES